MAGSTQQAEEAIRFLLDGLEVDSLRDLKALVDVGRACSTSDAIILSVKQALDLSGRANLVYIHEDGNRPAIGAIVRANTSPWRVMMMNTNEDALLNHDHIEPGMF